MWNTFKSQWIVPFIGKNSVTRLREGTTLWALVSLTTSSTSLKAGFRFLSFLVIFSYSEVTHSQLLFGLSQSFLSRAVYSCYLHPENCRRILIKTNIPWGLQRAYYSSTWHSENQISRFSNNCGHFIVQFMQWWTFIHLISRLRVPDDLGHTHVRDCEPRTLSTDSTTFCKQASYFQAAYTRAFLSSSEVQICCDHQH